MTAYFFDSSALVKCYVAELGTRWVRDLCVPAAGHTLYVARIAGAEVIAALARRAKIGSLSILPARSVMAEFRTDFGSAYFIAEVTPVLVERAMDLSQAHGLRGYDAVQLASALEVNDERRRYGLAALILASADTELNRAAASEGLTVENPNAYP